jgi:hypothetical protein
MTATLRLRSDREDHGVLLVILRDILDLIKVSKTWSHDEKAERRRQFIDKISEVQPAATSVLQNEWETIKAEIMLEKGV